MAGKKLELRSYDAGVILEKTLKDEGLEDSMKVLGQELGVYSLDDLDVILDSDIESISTLTVAKRRKLQRLLSKRRSTVHDASQVIYTS